MIHPDWAPFIVTENGAHADAPRAIETLEGITDRLRAAAFAEFQAREAFNWAACAFKNEAPAALCKIWIELGHEEDKHMNWLLTRLSELGRNISERRVSDVLWISLRRCTSAETFAKFMANSEDRGRRAGERFHQAMLARDPVSAEIFRKIAFEEIRHIEVASQFYGPAPSAPSFQSL